MIGKLIGYAGVALIAAAFVAGLVAYFVIAVGPDGHTADGFGRELVRAPAIMRWAFAVEAWPGVGWWIFDLIAFWSTVGLGLYLVSFGFGSLRHPPPYPTYTAEHLNEVTQERASRTPEDRGGRPPRLPGSC